MPYQCDQISFPGHCDLWTFVLAPGRADIQVAKLQHAGAVYTYLRVWLAIKPWTPSLKWASLASNTAQLSHIISGRTKCVPTWLHWERTPRSLYPISPGLHCPHVPLPFAGFDLHPFTGINHNHEDNSFWVQWALLVNLQTWGWSWGPPMKTNRQIKSQTIYNSLELTSPPTPYHSSTALDIREKFISGF